MERIGATLQNGKWMVGHLVARYLLLVLFSFFCQKLATLEPYEAKNNEVYMLK